MVWMLHTRGVLQHVPLSSESPENWQLEPELIPEIGGFRSDPLGQIVGGNVSIYQEEHTVWLSLCNVNSY